MPRPPVIQQSEFPYNISARCINREWFSLPMPEVWSIFCEELDLTCKKYSLQVHSFVLMSNHFHLIARTPEANISRCMFQFLGKTSRRLARAGNRINETFAGRHFKCILQGTNYFLNAYKYNYRNPVAAGICESVELYPFSTLPMVMKMTSQVIPLIEDSTYILDPVGTLKWLNQRPDPKKAEAVRFGLRHQYFRSKKDSSSNKPVLGESEVI
jgi:putative transposase